MAVRFVSVSMSATVMSPSRFQGDGFADDGCKIRIGQVDASVRASPPSEKRDHTNREVEKTPANVARPEGEM